jgi:hypothetical protein
VSLHHLIHNLHHLNELFDVSPFSASLKAILLDDKEHERHFRTREAFAAQEKSETERACEEAVQRAANLPLVKRSPEQMWRDEEMDKLLDSMYSWPKGDEAGDMLLFREVDGATAKCAKRACVTERSGLGGGGSGGTRVGPSVDAMLRRYENGTSLCPVCEASHGANPVAKANTADSETVTSDTCVGGVSGGAREPEHQQNMAAQEQRMPPFKRRDDLPKGNKADDRCFQQAYASGLIKIKRYG